MAIILHARKSVERENSISRETQLEYCKSVIKPDERDEKILTYVDKVFRRQYKPRRLPENDEAGAAG